LLHQPVLVVGGNDGNLVARSDEVKQLYDENKLRHPE
jgi:hypothetical protein